MSASKTRITYGLLAKVESVYGTAVALSNTTDGILALEPPDVKLGHLHDGSRNGRGPGIGPLARVGKSGRSGSLSVVTEAIGYGAAYSAVNLPSIHTLMRAAGLGSTVVTTASAESVTYAPVATSFASLTVEAYVNAMKYALAGVYADLNVQCEVGGVPRFEFALQGKSTANPVDAAVPAVTYPAGDPPKAESMILTIGNYLPVVVKEFSFSQGRELGPRAFDNTNGIHGGFTPGVINPMLEMVVEMVALTVGTPWSAAATLNPYELQERATRVNTYLTVGSAQYNKFKLAAPTAQLSEAEELSDGPTAQWRLKFSCAPSTYGALDQFSFLFN